MHAEKAHPDTHLTRDLDAWIARTSDRRQALRWLGLGAVSPLALAACGGADDATAASSSSGTSTSTSTGTTTTNTNHCT